MFLRQVVLDFAAAEAGYAESENRVVGETWPKPVYGFS